MKEFITQQQIEERIVELAAKIEQEASQDELIFIGILKGSFVFLADLIRQIKTSVIVDFIALSSYGDARESSGVVRLLKDLDVDIEGKDVIIIEDIIDTGLTLQYLVAYLRQRHPKSVKIATLLDKKERRQVEIDLDYVGFEIPDGFVVGYGIDCGQKYRNLPYIGLVE